MTRYRIYSGMMLLLLLILPVGAQDAPSSPTITAENVTDLQPVTSIDFDATFYEPLFVSPDPAATPDPDGRGGVVEPAVFETGWFAADGLGRYAVQTVDQSLWVIDADYTRWFTVEPPSNADALRPTFVDAVFNDNPDNLPWPLFAAYTDGERYIVMVADNGIYGNPFFSFFVQSSERPQAIWSTCFNENNYDCSPMLELTDWATNETVVRQMPSNNRLMEMLPMAGPLLDVYRESDVVEILYGPGADEDALIRIGRIEPPFAVTASPEGAVKRWDLSSGVMTAEATVENGPAVFGQLSADGRYLAWRDPMNDGLYLLDFDTGENRRIADLNGDYAQFFFVTDAGDVIFAVHLNDDPVVVAWDTATGERYDLGEYRECSRELDMARLLADDTTLTIGCDTGLEIWQVTAE